MRPLRREGNWFVIADGVCPTSPEHEVRIRTGRETWTCTVCGESGDALPPPRTYAAAPSSSDAGLALGLLRDHKRP